MLKLFAGLFLSLGLVFAGANAAEPKSDCCTKKLACCAKDKACCEATTKLACCAKAMACCAKDKGCCASVQECCDGAAKCCGEAKACCGPTAKEVAPKEGKGCCGQGKCCGGGWAARRPGLTGWPPHSHRGGEALASFVRLAGNLPTPLRPPLEQAADPFHPPIE